jgi:hypothetical protein
MTDPDDDWGDLARELGVQKPSTPPGEAAPEPRAEHEPEAAEGEQEEFAEGLADEPLMAEDAEGEADEGEAGEGDAAGGTEGGDEGPPGTGRKRRRRRRRRKKGGPEGAEGTDAGIADEPAPSYQAAGRAPVAVAPAMAAAEPAEADEEAGDAAEVGGAVSPAEEDTAGEVLRELIATWNVPSWDEIISGLNR